jgi:sugar/nucleoside kinase (ribokinase family)
MRPIVVVGDVIEDVIVRPAAAIAPDTDTPAEIVRRPGGSGANVAVWLAHLGAPVRFAGRAGAGGHELPGVDARLAIDPERPTGTIVVLVEGGRRTMLTDRGANQALGAEDLPPSLLDGAALLHVSGYALFAPTPRAATLALMAAARERDIPISVDCASAAFLREAPDFADWIADATICFANEDEARELGTAALRHPIMVVKRGAAGVTVRKPKGPGPFDMTAAPAEVEGKKGQTPFSLPAVAAEVVDPTGAGDALCAGFLARYVAGDAVEACARAGLAAAAEAVARAGGRPLRPSTPSRG